MGAGTDPLRRLVEAAADGGATAARRARAWMADTLDALVPDRCLACGETVERPPGRRSREPCGWCAPCAAFCLDCAAGPERHRCARAEHLRLDAAVQYGNEVAALVAAVKYQRLPEALAVWAEAWVAAHGPDGTGARATVDALVPVPAHPARVRERGLDVTGAWAARLGRLEAAPVVRALARRRATPAQVGRDRARRSANVAGAFAPGPEGGVIAGRRIALVDDVVTTGATLRECARVVRGLGALEVVGWAFAYEPLE